MFEDPTDCFSFCGHPYRKKICIWAAEAAENPALRPKKGVFLQKNVGKKCNLDDFHPATDQTDPETYPKIVW